MEEAASALHGEQLGIQPAPRHVSIEHLVLNQLDRIGYLRSVGKPWGEPMFHLRDLLVGLEDDEFWTGIPSLENQTKLSDKNKAEYAQRGWDNLEFDELIDDDGKQPGRPAPTPEQLSLAMRILMGLLARRGMTWRRRNRDRLIPDQGQAEDVEEAA